MVKTVIVEGLPEMSLMRRLERILRSNMTALKGRLVTGDRPIDSEHTSFHYNESGYSQPSGYSPDPMEAEYLANLELSGGASLPEIRSAYKRMIKKYHPDLHAQNEEKREYAKLITQRLNEAVDYFEQREGKGE